MLMMRRMMFFCLIVLLAGGTLTPAVARAEAGGGAVSGDRAEFARRWVRRHRFLLTAMVSTPDKALGGTASFRDLGLNAVISGPSEKALSYAVKHHLHWLVFERIHQATPQQVARLKKKYPGCLGFIINDEPGHNEMKAIGRKIKQLRQAHPDLLFFSNALPSYATKKQLWGNNTNPQYRFKQYIHDFIHIIQPDVMMYDFYPFRRGHRLKKSFYSDMMIVRNASRKAGIPYYAWLQAYRWGSMPEASRSDMRMQAFAMMTAGYKGFAYWVYGYHAPSARRPHPEDMVTLKKGSPAPTTLYQRVKTFTAELANLGGTLRRLRSTAVRFVPGQNASGQSHHSPSSIKTFARDDKVDSHIQSVRVLDAGEAKDGLLGLFTNKSDEHYFLLTNLCHGRNLSPAQATVRFRITFDDSVHALQRFNRKTGKKETVKLTAHVLEVQLPGGTGDLFKYDFASSAAHR